MGALLRSWSRRRRWVWVWSRRRALCSRGYPPKVRACEANSSRTCGVGRGVGTAQGNRVSFDRLRCFWQWVARRVDSTVGSSLRVHGGKGALQLVVRCPRGDRRGRVVVVRGRWLRPLSLRCYGGEVMENEARMRRLMKSLPLPRRDQRGMAWVARDRWLRLQNLPGSGGEVTGTDVR